MATPKTKMFRDDAPKISKDDAHIVMTFLDALLPGMLYVKCGICHKFKQVVSPWPKLVPDPSDPRGRDRIQLQVCEECR